MDGKGKQRMMGRVVKRKTEVSEESSDDDGYEQQHMGCVEDDTESYKRKKLVTASGGGRRGSSGGGAGMRCCQAERCTADLSEAKPYHKRHKVCEHHSKAQVVLVGGTRQRFCQQCSRLGMILSFFVIASAGYALNFESFGPSYGPFYLQLHLTQVLLNKCIIASGCFWF